MAGTGVGKFSSTAGSNTANMTVNFAENMAPSNVNNAARELMGHMRDMYEQLGDGYFEFGDGDGTYTVARSDADTITITSSSDISSVYFAGRKIRITDGGANVVEGTIASSSHSSTTQTVNLTGISLASGTPTKVELGIDTASFGGRVILDDDGDTYIEAPTDDTIDIYVAGAKDFVITANTFTAESGSTIAAQALTATTVTASGIVKTDDTTDATSTTDGSLQTDGGLSVAKDAVFGDDVKLLSDSAILNFGADSDTTLTHTDGTGLTLNSTNKLCFNDASQFIQGSSATVLSIGATDEIDLTATAVDLNGTLNVSGVATFQSTPVFPDGSIAVADLDIDGATDIGEAIVDADLFIIDNGAGGTNRKVAASRLKTYAGGGGSDPSSADGDSLGTASLEWSDLYLADGGIIYFGNDQDVTLTHVADSGLNLKSIATGDDKPITLTLQTGETDLAANDVIGKIAFQAPDEGTGTDAILVSGAIQAVAEGDHSSSSNATRLEFMTGASEAATSQMTISSGGIVGIGSGVPGDLGIGLHIKEGDSGSSSVDDHANQLVIEHGTSGEGCGISFLAATDGFVRLAFGDSDDDNIGQIVYNNSGNTLQFFADTARVIQISDNEHTLFNTVATNTPGYGNNTAGHTLRSNGAAYHSATTTFHSFNRTNDGTVISLSSAGGEEGLISISGSTTSYGAFTGSHWTRLSDNSKPTILRGTIMESLDTMMDWYQAEAEVAGYTDSLGIAVPGYTITEPITLPDGKSVGDAVTFTVDGVEHTGVYKKEDDVKHVKCKVSDTADSTKVYGLFHCWDDQDDGLDGDVNDMEVAQVGTYIIRVHKDVTVSAGDLLVSNGDGTAKKQDDDIIRSKTVAKVNSNVKVETYADGSYTVPCTLHC